MSKFEYQRLSRSEITAISTQFQIANISDYDLINPNPDVISESRSLHADPHSSRLFAQVSDLCREDHEQLEFSALEHLENPGLHVDSVRVTELYNRIKVASLECPKKFILRELRTPDADRTEFFLSSRDPRMNSITEIVDEVNLFEDQQRDLEAKILQVKAEITECNEAREREIPLVQEVDANVKELRQTIAALNNNQMSLRASYRKLKEKTGEMDEKISSAEFSLVENVQENAHLRSKIVQSLDKLEALINLFL
ncbi:hypothetical protein L6164_036214 [Bauhinia variegata]|uniref:Uncharacterized protein n=1 Tax=Bauhinia variegata TaxID=167791 RepID=A0ACB9KGD4_BAUVA|nr:hypothetical protein L6164_036214 [Bauhinia variegata]